MYNIKQKNKGFIYTIRKTLPMCAKVKPAYYVWSLILNVVVGLLIGAELLVTQVFFDAAYNVTNGTDTVSALIFGFGAYSVLKLLIYIFEGLRQYFIEVHGTYVMGYIMSAIHKKSGIIPPVLYEDPKHLDAINQAINGVDSTIYLNSIVSFIFTYHLPYFCFMIWYLNQIKTELILCLIFVLVPVWISHVFRSNLHAKLEDQLAPDRRKYDAYNDVCCGRNFYKETRTLGAFSFLRSRLLDTVRSLNTSTWKIKKKIAAIDTLFNTISLFGYGGVLLLALKFLLDGEISVGAFAAVFSSIDILFSTMEYFVENHIGTIAGSYAEVRNLLSFLEISEDDTVSHSFEKNDTICVDRVSFQYPNMQVVSLKNINLRINPGETIAIVGENGAGKTTLAKVILGIYAPCSGYVKIGTTDLNSTNYENRFKRVTGVFQKYQKYAFTLRNNVQIADLQAPEGEHKVRAVLTEVQIDANDTTKFPNNIDTMLSPEFDGVDLSGGEWQRVALARGLFREGDIVVLDEPTAAIDPIEETKIYKAFAAWAKGKTAILISHRLGSVKIADRIVVMKTGEIVGIGTHEELMNNNRVYAELYESQAQWYR